MKKGLAIGIDDFKQLIKEDCYYIDKTKFIEDILKDKAGVKLFIRPRRFGKTLNMSTLKYFLDVENKEENRELFKNLYIENSPLFREQGQYPVVFISMKGIQGDSFQSLLKTFELYIKEVFRQYIYLEEKLDNIKKEIFFRYIKESLTLEELKNSLNILLEILSSCYKKQVILLIDEYDAPLLSAYGFGYYNEAVNFFKLLYGSVLKSNINLKMGVMTGAVRIAQAGIFSDLNNLKVNTILSEKYDEYFGLIEKEVEQALKDYEIEYKLDEVKEWYDGYKFGNMEVYNPWSILNYIDNGKLKAYWINTSGNLVIKDLLMKSDSGVFETLQELIEGKDKIVFINENIALGNNLAPNSLWELMLFSGYLTVEEKIDYTTYTVRIPNQEVRSFFKTLFVDVLFTSKYRNIGEMKQALVSKNFNGILDSFKDVLLNIASYHDVDKRFENSYHMLFTGFFYGVSDLFVVYSNIETGYGRADLILKSKNNRYPSYIFEFKKADCVNLKEVAKKAYEQIELRKYDTLLLKEEIKNIVKIGLAFNGKIVEGYTE